MSKKILLWLIIFIFGVAIGARFYHLQWHFAHVDDVGVAKSIIKNQLEEKSSFSAVSHHWTYAPFQFLLTSVLISSQQNYRDLLWWGRFPSALAGILGLATMFLFYRRWGKGLEGEMCLALALLACSLENIIMAQQMHNYALGVVALVGMMQLLADAFHRNKLNVPILAGYSLGLALLSYMHYSILFFIPAFFITVFLKDYPHQARKLKMVAGQLVGGLIYLIFVFPLWFLLKKHTSAGVVDWNSGPAQEFIFKLNESTGVFQQLTDILGFFVNNFYLIFQTHTAFLPEDHCLFSFFAIVFFVFFVVGIVRFMRGESQERFLLLFFVLSLATWILLVIQGKLTFSPTRHTLILLPLFVFFTAAGSVSVGGWFSRLVKIPWIANLNPVLSLLILVLFLVNYPQFLKERKDPFDEKNIAEILKQYQVDGVIQAQWTDQVEVMKSVRELYGHKAGDFNPYVLISNSSTPYKRLAWISHREKLNPINFERARDYLNHYLYFLNPIRQQRNDPTQAFLQDPHYAYRVIYAQQMDSDVETEFSRRTHNGTNGFYFYILEHL